MSVADNIRIQQMQVAAATHAALEGRIAQLASRAPHMLAEGGPGFVVESTVITLPGDGRLRFQGTLEVVE